MSTLLEDPVGDRSLPFNRIARGNLRSGLFRAWRIMAIAGMAVILVVGLLDRQNQIDGALAPGAKADLVVVRKAERMLDLYSGSSLLKTYRVALGPAASGHKEREGDNRTPEGWYRIDFRNPNSAYHLSLHISYPNDTDVARAKQLGVSPGGDIMIHGGKSGFGWLGALHRNVDWTRGCIAVTNAEMDEIWNAVPDGTRINILA